MGERLAPWRPRPPQEVLEVLQQVPDTVLYLVHRIGPTSFLVREDGSEIKRKVTIGSRPCCSCTPPAANGGCKELCLHLLFVMVKVLRVPPSNPLVWQLSLTDRELEEVLRCSSMPEHPPPPPPDARKAAAEKTEPGQVKRKPVDEEDPCPICYEDMVNVDPDLLVWCRFGCGRNVHGKCMGIWAEHQQRTLGKELSCPLCRSAWGEFKWKPPPPKKKKMAAPGAGGVHPGTKCGTCKKAPLAGKRYRCLICADYDLCEVCFSGGHHPQHPFACKETPGSFGVPAERPVMMPVITRLATTAGTAGAGEGGADADASDPAAGSDGAEPASGVTEHAETDTAEGSAAGGGPAADQATGLSRPRADSQPRGGRRSRGRPPAAVAAARAAEARAAAAAGEGEGVGGTAGLGVEATPMTITGAAHRRGRHAHGAGLVPGRAHGHAHNPSASPLEVQGLSGGEAMGHGAAPAAAASGHPALTLMQQQRVRKGLARQASMPSPGHAAAAAAERRAANLDNGLQGAGVLAGGAVPAHLAMDAEVIALLEGRHAHDRAAALPATAFGRAVPGVMRGRGAAAEQEPAPGPLTFNISGRSVLPHSDQASEDEAQPAGLDRGLRAAGAPLPRGMQAAMAGHRRFLRAMSDGAKSPDVHGARSSSAAAAAGRDLALQPTSHADGFSMLTVGGRAVAPAPDLQHQDPEDLFPAASGVNQPGGRLMRGRPPLPRLQHPSPQGVSAPSNGARAAMHAPAAARELAFGGSVPRDAASRRQPPAGSAGRDLVSLRLDANPYSGAGSQQSEGTVLPRIRAARPRSAQDAPPPPMLSDQPVHHEHDAADISSRSRPGSQEDPMAAPANEMLHHPAHQGPHSPLHDSTALRRSLSAGARMTSPSAGLSRLGPRWPWQEADAAEDPEAVFSQAPYQPSDWAALRQRAAAVQEEASPVMQLARTVLQDRAAPAEVLLARSPPRMRTPADPAASSHQGTVSAADAARSSTLWSAAISDDVLMASSDVLPALPAHGAAREAARQSMDRSAAAQAVTPAASGVPYGEHEPGPLAPQGVALDRSAQLSDSAVKSVVQCAESRSSLGDLMAGAAGSSAGQPATSFGNGAGAYDAAVTTAAKMGGPMQVSERGSWATLYSNPVYNLKSTSIDFG